MPPYEGPTKFYAEELGKALEAGLLLSSLQLASSYLECFIRELLIDHLSGLFASSFDVSHVNLVNHLEALLEDSSEPEWNFNRMLRYLHDTGVIQSIDAQHFIEFYRHIRTPVMHGLTRRFVRGDRLPTEVLASASHLNNRFEYRCERVLHLENLIETGSIDFIEELLSTISKYADLFAA